MSVLVPFTKMAGAGNDFLITDAVHHRTLGSLKAAWPRVARAMCDRRYGVGADGLLVLERSRVADVRMRIFNPDGSEAEMCGNGARCVASYVKRRGTATLETRAGVVTAAVQGDRVAMQMPDPRDLRLDLSLHVNGSIRSLSSVDTGVPHVVAVVTHLDQIDVDTLGRQIRFNQAFQPRGTNVNFVEANPKNSHRLRVRTYERGVEAETLACGTGAVAAAVIHALRTEVRKCQTRIETKSGETLTVSLTIAGPSRARTVTDVVLEGGVRWICEGDFRWR